ncbi:hypothetical protein JK358_11680 [Nocardia sp. 2]|uniref:DUF998 domain-containing protein n=1 Tax=Nocardia acididurans TaxID=2802282 RepID=A0ABS1M5H8_9NOCA|nr:hypothetical protein [Nocardia acididurans]MBL1075054.1 hypothetical protein [Nocardia acididurans]
MTTLATPQLSAAITRDRIRRAYLLIAGGVLWSIGNALHPLEHSEAAEQAATWKAAHLTFALGSVLIAVGLPVIFAALRATIGESDWTAKLRAAAAPLLFIGFAVTVPIGAYHEMFVVTQLDHHDQHAIEDAAAPLLNPLAATLLLGLILLAVAAIARPAPALGRVSGILILVAVVAMGAAPGLPGAEGVWIIPGTIVVGVVLAVAAFRTTTASQA